MRRFFPFHLYGLGCGINHHLFLLSRFLSRFNGISPSWVSYHGTWYYTLGQGNFESGRGKPNRSIGRKKSLISECKSLVGILFPHCSLSLTAIAYQLAENKKAFKFTSIVLN